LAQHSDCSALYKLVAAFLLYWHCKLLALGWMGAWSFGCCSLCLQELVPASRVMISVNHCLCSSCSLRILFCPMLQGEVPPPFCLGIEFMRYGKAVMKLRQPAGTGEAHTTSLASTVSAAPDVSDGPSIPVPGYQYTTHEHHHQLSHAHKSTSQDTDASDGGSSQQPAHALQAEAAGAQQQRLNLMERLEQVRFCCFCLPGAATQPHSCVRHPPAQVIRGRFSVFHV